MGQEDSSHDAIEFVLSHFAARSLSRYQPRNRNISTVRCTFGVDDGKGFCCNTFPPITPVVLQQLCK